ncbi:MAG: laminin B domain-containing protein [Pseudomonadota bacterium]
MRSFMVSTAAALAVALSPAAATAAVLVQSTFDASAEGWRRGDMVSPGSEFAAPWEAAGYITGADNFNLAALIAPTAWLGDQSAAFGGTFSFDIRVAANDAPESYPALALISGSTVLYAKRGFIPAVNTWSSYSVGLTGDNFYTGNFYSGAGVVTDADLQAVLANLTRVSVLVDWNSGGDDVRLDNVVLASSASGNPGAIPEPSAWALMILGFGAAGSMLRAGRRRALA